MRIVIPGPPIPNARHKCVCRGRHAAAYDGQAKIRQAEKRALSQQIDLLANSHADELKALSSGPLRLSLWLYMPVNDSDSKAIRNAKLWGLILPDSKPDFDNLTKWACDLANGVIWTDDSQIVEAHIVEQYSENPCTILEISVIKNCMNDNATKVCKIFSPLELEILQTHLCVLRDAIEQIDRYAGDEKKYYIEHASNELIVFANEYAQKLNKLKKHD